MKYLFYLAILGGVVFFAATYFMNKFNASRDKIRKLERELSDLLEKRLKSIERLEQNLGSEATIGRSAVDAALRNSRKIHNTTNLHEKSILMSETESHLDRATLQLRNPNISQPGTQVLESLNELDEVNRKIKVARRSYNDEVRDYNQMITSGPGGFVAPLLKFEPADPFPNNAD